MSENLGRLGSKQDDDSNSAVVFAAVVVIADVVIAIVVVVLVELVLVGEVIIELIVAVETGSLWKLSYDRRYTTEPRISDFRQYVS